MLAEESSEHLSTHSKWLTSGGTRSGSIMSCQSDPLTSEFCSPGVGRGDGDAAGVTGSSVEVWSLSRSDVGGTGSDVSVHSGTGGVSPLSSRSDSSSSSDAMDDSRRYNIMLLSYITNDLHSLSQTTLSGN